MPDNQGNIADLVVDALRNGIEEIRKQIKESRDRSEALLPHDKTYSEHSGTSS